MEKLIKKILLEIGENPDREGLKDTPKRVVKMYKEIFRGYNNLQKPFLTTFNNGVDGIKYEGILTDTGYFFSHCEHHMVPFFGTYYFGYIPDKLIIGASKIARLIDFHSAKLQIAERLSKDILDDIEKAIEPQGSILLMSARHLCKEMRGVKKVNSPFEAIDARGIFRENKDGCKDEFINRIKVKI